MGNDFHMSPVQMGTFGFQCTDVFRWHNKTFNSAFLSNIQFFEPMSLTLCQSRQLCINTYLVRMPGGLDLRTNKANYHHICSYLVRIIGVVYQLIHQNSVCYNLVLYHERIYTGNNHRYAREHFETDLAFCMQTIPFMCCWVANVAWLFSWFETVNVC